MFRKSVTCYLIMAMFIIGLVPRVDAAFVPSRALTGGYEREADMQKIQAVLESKLVQQRLGDLGFTEEEINARLAQLSDEQLHQLALKLDELRVGQNALGIIIALLVIAILVLVVLHLTGHKVLVTQR